MGAKTLFATHYHELSELEGQLPGVKNYCITVMEHGEDVIFLRKIVPGGADKSYGVHVARLAGIPAPVVARAHEIQARLEVSDINQETISQNILEKKKKKTGRRIMFHLPQDDLIEELKNLDVLSITPHGRAQYALPASGKGTQTLRSSYGRNTEAFFGFDRKDRRGRGGGTPCLRGEGTGGKRHRRGG